MNSGPQSKASILDHTWVMRWLDDIGLPQYKDNFFDARVDGRMLHTMTVVSIVILKNGTLKISTVIIVEMGQFSFTLR